MTLTFNPALPDTLQDLLRSHAPEATLLADVGSGVWSLRADQAACKVSDLTPPDHWFDSGELIWLTRDGALLGLLWSAQVVADSTVQLLTLLLATARNDSGHHEANVLITQLPEGAAWLSDRLVFLQVSRRFLELHRLSAAQVVGQPFEAVFPLRHAAGQLLMQAASGRAVIQDRELLCGAAGTRGTWLRSQMRPYYGGSAAGVLWTMQDISQEIALSARIHALLLETRLPTAVLSASGEVLERSESLRSSLPDAPDPQHVLLWKWPIWHDPAECEVQLKAALSEALNRPQQRFERSVQVLGGESASVSLRLGEDPAVPGEHQDALLVAEFRFHERHDPLGTRHTLLAGVIAHSPQPTLLLGAADDSGERPVWLASEAAAKLLGVPLTALNVPGGVPLGRLLRTLNVQLSRPDLTALSSITLTTQASLDGGDLAAVLTRPDGMRRYIQINAARLTSGEGTALKDEPLALYLHDVTAIRSLEERLKHDAGHDPLTGLPNWPGLRAKLNAQVHPQGAQPELGVLVLGLDEFGVLQAAMGRSAGDHLLIQVAARLHHWLKDVQVARLEGEHFVLIWAGRGRSAAIKLSGEIQELLSPPLKVGGREMRVSASVGVAYGAENAEQLLEQARTALLAGRRTGRAGRQIFTPELMSREAGLLELEHDLRGAVPEQFTLLFQPVVNLHTGRVQGAEVLLRWQHPTRGLLTPAQFLPLATRANLLPSLGHWVVTQVSAQRQHWKGAYPKLRLGINLSTSELLDTRILAELERELQGVGGLDIELSAGSLIGSNAAESAGTALFQLHQSGAKIWVDDFGDGAFEPHRPGALCPQRRETAPHLCRQPAQRPASAGPGGRHRESGPKARPASHRGGRGDPGSGGGAQGRRLSRGPGLFLLAADGRQRV